MNANTQKFMNISVVNTLNEDQIAQLHALYQHEWFSKGRRLEDVREMLEHSDFVFGFCASDNDLGL
jgi:hypothetical protein